MVQLCVFKLINSQFLKVIDYVQSVKYRIIYKIIDISIVVSGCSRFLAGNTCKVVHMLLKII